MTVNVNLLNDIWGYEELIKRYTSNLFNPLPDVHGALSAAKRERYEAKRVALLYFVEGLLSDKEGALAYGYELAVDTLPQRLDDKAFDVVSAQPDHRPFKEDE